MPGGGMGRRGLWLCGCLALGACTLGPNYRLPALAIVNDPSARGSFVSKGPALSEAPLPPNWWRLYQDPRLDDLIQAALAANTDLRVADANLERSHALLQEAKSEQQPRIAVDAGVEDSQIAGEQYGRPITPPVNGYYAGGATIGYDLDLFGGIRRGIEAAKADDQAVEAARDLVRVNVAGETARAYADACGDGLQLAAAKRSLALQQESLAMTLRLIRGGRAIALDATRAHQLVDQQMTTIPVLEAGQRNALFRLATLTGRPPALFDQDLQACSQPPRLAQALPVGDGQMLLKRRPDVRQAERQLAAATAEIGVQTAALFPDISIGVSGGSNGSIATALTSPTNYWAIGPLLSWQANQSATRARIMGAKAGARMALAHFDGVVLGALRDTDMALNLYLHDLQREQSAIAARDDAAKAVSDSQRLQHDGRATALGVLDAERTLASSEQSLAQLRSSISTDQIAVFLSLGGGWETKPPT